MLIEQLQALGYDYREFLLTPSQLSVPNSRLRYFLLVWAVEKQGLIGCPSVTQACVTFRASVDRR